MKSFATACLVLGVAQATEMFLGAEQMTESDYKFIGYVAKFGKSYGTKAEFDFRSA